MRRLLLIALILGLVCMITGPPLANAATEQQKRAAIDAGLAYLASTGNESATEKYYNYSNNGELAATASAALAFIEEGYLPNDGSAYGAQVGKMCNYIFNRAKEDNIVAETSGYWRHAEDYNSDGILNDGGNGKGVWFDPAYYKRDIYTNGIVTPVVHALGEALGKDTVVGMGSAAVATKTYAQVMQDVADWFAYGQTEPSRGVHRGGWRYTPNYSTSDNSTAQWGALPFLYADDWGLGVSDFVGNELNTYCNYIQHGQDGTYKAGGSGYSDPNSYVNPAKTGGLLLELAVTGADISDPRVQNALGYLTSMVTYDHWNQGATTAYSQWYGGHIGNPYSMWAIYKALEVWGFTGVDPGPDGILGTADDFLVGNGISSSAGGITIGQDWDPTTSAAGDWYSQYCDWLVNNQNANGSWNGYAYWNGPLAAGWYINILNATGAPPPDNVPEPTTLAIWSLLGASGLALARVRRRRKT